jgi:hypothetical protein
MFLAGGPHRDFNVLTQSHEKFHETSDGEVTRAVPHQQGNLRLPHAENLGDFDLRHAAALEDRMDLQDEPRLEQLLLRIGKAEVREDVSAALGYTGNAGVCFSCFGFQLSSAFLYSPARLPLAAG